MRISDWSSDVCSSDLSSSPPSVSPHPSHADRPCTTLRPCGQREISVARKLPIIAPATAPARAITMSLRLSASGHRSEEHTSELQSLMRISYAVFCLKKKPTTSTLYSLIHNPPCPLA